MRYNFLTLSIIFAGATGNASDLVCSNQKAGSGKIEVIALSESTGEVTSLEVLGIKFLKSEIKTSSMGKNLQTVTFEKMDDDDNQINARFSYQEVGNQLLASISVDIAGMGTEESLLFCK